MKKWLVALGLGLFLSMPFISLGDDLPLPGGVSNGAAPTQGVDAPAGPAAAGQQSLLSILPPIAMMFGLIYFLVMRPQQKRQKEQTSMLKELKRDDEVVSTSGIIGKITGIADKVVTLEVSSGVRIKMLKSQVAKVINGKVEDLA